MAGRDLCWEVVRIYDGPEEFVKQFAALRIEVGHLFATHWCVSEVCNGGLHQFFTNCTGVLAPEAAAGFRAIGMKSCATVLEKAMQFFGKAYPRDQEVRQAALDKVRSDGDEAPGAFDKLDEQFYRHIGDGCAGYQKAADEYAVRVAQAE